MVTKIGKGVRGLALSRTRHRRLLTASQDCTKCLEDHHVSLLCERTFSHARHALHVFCEQQRLAPDRTKQSRGTIMKTLVSALLALSVLTGVTASASAFDAKSFYEQQDRERGN